MCFVRRGEGRVTLGADRERTATLDCAVLFDEVVAREDELKARVTAIYADIPAMRDASKIQYANGEGQH